MFTFIKQQLIRASLMVVGIGMSLLLLECVRRVDLRIRKGVPLLTNPRSLWHETRGWIGKEHTLGATTDEPILVLGDSFTDGLGVPSDKMWFSYLREAFPDRQIIAYGGLGYGTLQEAMMLEEYRAKGVTPSLIVLQICSNDISNSYYPFEVGSQLQRPPAPRPYMEGDEVVVRFPRRFGAVLAPLISYSQLAYMLNNRWDLMTVQWASEGKIDSIEYRIQKTGYGDPLFRAASLATERLLEKFKAAAGTTPVVLMLVDDSEPYTGALRDIAGRVGLPIVVPQRLSPVASSGKLEDGAHLNEEGNRIVGQTFVRVAQERQLFSFRGLPTDVSGSR